MSEWWTQGRFEILRLLLSFRNTQQGKRKRLRCTCPVGKRVFSFLCPTVSSTYPLAELERTESIACPEKRVEELCPKCLPVLWTSKHKLTLVPQTK